MSYLMAAARDCAPYAAGALGAAGLGLVAMLVGATIVRKRLGSRAALTWLTAGTLSFGVAVALGVAAIRAGRLDLATATLPGAAAREADVTYQGVQLQVLGSALIGGSILVFAIARACLSLVTRPRAASWFAVAWLLPLAPVAAGALGYGLRLGRGITDVSLAPPAGKALGLFQAVEAAQVVLGWARLALGGAVVLAAVVAIAAWRRAGPVNTVPSRKVFGAGLLLLAGVAAYLMTRDHAVDRGPLPFLAAGALSASEASTLPRVSSCPAPAESAPLLSFEGNAVTLNAAPVDPGQFQEQLRATRASYPLLHEGRAPSLLMIVRASPRTPITSLIPYLERAGAGEIHVASAVLRHFQSRTLGRIERYEYCGRPLRLSDTGMPLSTFATWSELSAAMERSRAPMEMAAK
ncbi:MAG TPA: hypothetical protein VN914_10710 [Polyangia bacterium]|nr:hypothetical protein [Polyangia bacterium]